MKLKESNEILQGSGTSFWNVKSTSEDHDQPIAQAKTSVHTQVIGNQKFVPVPTETTPNVVIDINSNEEDRHKTETLADAVRTISPFSLRYFKNKDTDSKFKYCYMSISNENCVYESASPNERSHSFLIAISVQLTAIVKVLLILNATECKYFRIKIQNIRHILFKRAFPSLLEVSMKMCMVVGTNISTFLQFHIFSAPYVFSSSLFDGERNLIFNKSTVQQFIKIFLSLKAYQ